MIILLIAGNNNNGNNNNNNNNNKNNNAHLVTIPSKREKNVDSCYKQSIKHRKV